MKVAGVREFRRDVPHLVKDKELVLVTWHGRPESVLVPIGDISELPHELRMKFLRQSGKVMRARFTELGLKEDDILTEFEAWRNARRARRR